MKMIITHWFRFRFLFLLPAFLPCGILACGMLACGTAPPPPLATQFAAEAAPDPRLQPTFDPAPPATAETRQDQRTVRRREILDAVWRTVRDMHYDPRLGGLDWPAVRRRYEPLALGAPSDAAFYRALNDMIGELGQSHMVVTGPGADDDIAEDTATVPQDPTTTPAGPAAASAPPLLSGATPAGTTAPVPATLSGPPGAPVVVTGVGDPGVTVRSIEGRPTVTAVRPASSAARHRLAPGFIITAIGGRPLATVSGSKRPLRPVEERFALRRAALHLLQGPVGSKVTVAYLDNDDRPGQVILERDPPAGPSRQIGHLPPLHPETRISEVGGVGIIAFNMFLLDPLLPEIKQAMDRFRAVHVKGMILDLRGNPGGLGAMAIPVASEFVAAPTTLGTLQFRTFSQTFTAQPSLGRIPYTGPLVILTDEGTASASEILAAGLQEAGRARVVGDTTLGAVLPSVVEALPHGVVMQMVVADFKTPKGILVEGRGVQPDRRVLETRSALRAGHDPVIDAALSVLKMRTGATAKRQPRP
ncbi:MAG: S41 family peptidase [Polyangia bacterium]